MADFNTETARLPMLLEAARPRPSLKRTPTMACFVSQLLAERNNLAPQRARRRNSAQGAIGAYTDGARVAIKRMPVGYRTTIVA